MKKVIFGIILVFMALLLLRYGFESNKPSQGGESSEVIQKSHESSLQSGESSETNNDLANTPPQTPPARGGASFDLPSLASGESPKSPKSLLQSGESKSSPSQMRTGDTHKSSPSQMRAGDKGGGYKNTKDSNNAEFDSVDSTHPLRHPSAREGEQKDKSAESRNDKMSKSAESNNPKSPESSINRNTFFAGIELGYMRFEYAESGVIGTNALLNPSSNDAFNAGIIAGYRYFFNDSVGIRGYANLNYNYDKANGFGELKMLNVGINADFLLNFYASQSVDFGAIVGLGFGG